MKFSNLTRQRVLTLVLMGALGLNMSWRILGHISAIELASNEAQESNSTTQDPSTSTKTAKITINDQLYNVNLNQRGENLVVDGAPADGTCTVNCAFATVLPNFSNTDDVAAIQQKIKAYLNTRNAPTANATPAAPAPSAESETAKVEDHSAFPNQCKGRSGTSKIECLADYLVKMSNVWSCTDVETTEQQKKCDDDKYKPELAKGWVNSFYAKNLDKSIKNVIAKCVKDRNRSNQNTFGASYGTNTYGSFRNNLAGFDDSSSSCEDYDDIVNIMGNLISGLERDSGNDVKNKLIALLDKSFQLEAEPINQMWQLANDKTAPVELQQMRLNQFQTAYRNLADRYTNTSNLLSSNLLSDPFNGMSYNAYDHSTLFQNGFRYCVGNMLGTITTSDPQAWSTPCNGVPLTDPTNNPYSPLLFSNRISNTSLRFKGSSAEYLSTFPQSGVDSYNVFNGFGTNSANFTNPTFQPNQFNTNPLDRNARTRPFNSTTEATLPNSLNNSQTTTIPSGIPQM